MVFDIKLLRVFMGHILMDEMSTFWLHGHTDVLGRLLHKSFRILPHILALWWGMERKSVSRKIYDGVVNFCVPNFQNSIELFQ